MTALLVGLAGMLGALLRFGLESALAAGGRFAAGHFAAGRSRKFPLATLLVNAVGSFLIGVVGGLSAQAQITPEWHSAIAAGLAGGLTTFSSFTVATVLLWRERSRLAASANIVLNVGLGLLLAWLGFALVS